MPKVSVPTPTVDEIFAAVRSFVDQRTAATPLGEKLRKAVEHCASSHPEDWSSAALSCRRALKDLADQVFPPRQQPVNGHEVGEEEYVYRLWAYAAAQIDSETGRQIMEARLRGLGAQVDAVYSMTNKFRFVAADGSTLSGSYQFLFVPPDQGGFFSLFVEDGTRRLEGASGQLDLSFENSGMVQCVDPLCLGSATLEPAVFEGTLSLPRP